MSSTTEKPIVVVTRPPLPPEVDQRVSRDFRPRIAATPESLTPHGLLALADGASALLVTGADRLDGDFFDHIPRSVEIVATAATIETQTAIGMLALDNVDAVLSGRPAPTLVTPPE